MSTFLDLPDVVLIELAIDGIAHDLLRLAEEDVVQRDGHGQSLRELEGATKGLLDGNDVGSFLRVADPIPLGVENASLDGVAELLETKLDLLVNRHVA